MVAVLCVLLTSLSVRHTYDLTLVFAFPVTFLDTGAALEDNQGLLGAMDLSPDLQEPPAALPMAILGVQ